MKKKIVLLLLCMICIVPAGCGKESSDKNALEGTETAGEKSGVNSTDIKYDVNDYVTLGDYKDVEVTIGSEADYEVTEDKINDYAAQMISYYCPYVKDDTKTQIEENDIVDVDYVGKKDGAAFEGGSAEHQIIDVAKNSDALRGTGYIEGFTDGLKGAKVGETVDCNVTFPENYQSQELAGQEVTFTFTVNSVQKPMTLEDMDDTIAKEYFQEDTKDAFMENVKKVLESQTENTRQSDIRMKVIDAVTEKCEIKELPEGLLDARVEEYIAGFEKTYCTNGTTLEEYVKNSGSTIEDFRKEITENMKDNIRQEMVFEAIAEKENIEFNEDEYNNYVSNLVQNGGFKDVDTVYETYGADKESGEKYIRKVYLQNKACQKIADGAKVNYGEKENS